MMDSFERLRQLVGQELGVSHWFTIDQERIGKIAKRVVEQLEQMYPVTTEYL
ncbi:MAG: hypothetical protein ABIK11_08315 [candidate division WOR-3 bacterium]